MVIDGKNKSSYDNTCHGAEAVATEYMYSRSLQDIAQSIVRVKGVRRVIYLHIADVSCI